MGIALQDSQLFIELRGVIELKYYTYIQLLVYTMKISPFRQAEMQDHSQGWRVQSRPALLQAWAHDFAQ